MLRLLQRGAWPILPHISLQVRRNSSSKTIVSNVDAKTAPIDTVALRRLMTFIKPELIPIGASVGTLAVTTGISLAFPYFIGQILDVALHPNPLWCVYIRPV